MEKPECPRCKKTGKVKAKGSKEQMTCPLCKGSGEIPPLHAIVENETSLALYYWECSCEIKKYDMTLRYVHPANHVVCDNHRIHKHKVLAQFAQRGKGSIGWFYGFKLHLVVNECGELLACQITPGNVDDRTPVPTLCRRLFVKLIADRGYVSQALFEQLLDTFGVQLITKLRKNMKNRLLPLLDKLLLRKRAILESLIDQLKNISQIEHTRHRSPINCFINIIAGLIAYCHQPKKPSLHLSSAALLSA